MLHGARDRATLRATGMAFDVKVRDVEAHDRAQRRADQAWAQARDESALPSGNTAYRRLPGLRGGAQGSSRSSTRGS